MGELRGNAGGRDEAETLRQLHTLLQQVLEHGFGEVVIKIQEGKVVTMEKKEVYKRRKGR